MEFASLSRQEQKKILKEWNAKAKQIKDSCSFQPSCQPPHEAVEPKPAYMGNVMNEDEDAKNDPLTSVAAIHSSYRNRQRHVEKTQQMLVKRTDQYKKWQQIKTESEAKRSRKGDHFGSIEAQPEEVVDTELNEVPEKGNFIVNEAVATPVTPSDFTLNNIIYGQFNRDLVYKQTVLSQIRAQLLVGLPVIIRNDTKATGDATSDTRLLLQQLCLASLLYCSRDQELVPTIEGTIVSIKLMPKVR
jgi:hypothetical protein